MYGSERAGGCDSPGYAPAMTLGTAQNLAMNHSINSMRATNSASAIQASRSSQSKWASRSVEYQNGPRDRNGLSTAPRTSPSHEQLLVLSPIEQQAGILTRMRPRSRQIHPHMTNPRF